MTSVDALTPAPVSTGTGTLLPIVALPQTALLSVDEKDIPVFRDAFGEGIHYQPLRLDVEHNEWVVRAIFEPGTALPLHYHTGPVDLFTLQGRWYYAEYPEQPQTAGCYLYEPGGSVHTFTVPADNTEDTIVVVRVSGTNINFNDDATFHSLLDAVFLRYLTDQLSEALGVKPRYIEGGPAGYTAP